MDHSFSQWRNSSQNSSSRLNGESFIISDSDEDVSEIVKNRDAFVIDESNDDSIPVSKNIMPRKSPISTSDDDTPINPLTKSTVKKKVKRYNIEYSDNSTNDDEDEDEDYNDFDNSDSDEGPIANSSISYSPVKSKGEKRKDITHNDTREDIKELKVNSSSESFSDKSLVNNNMSHEQHNDERLPDVNDKASHDMPETIILDSDSCSGKNSEDEIAMSFAKEEIGVGNVNPLVAQKRAIIVCKLEQLKNQLAKTKLLTKANIEMLPDKGKKLYRSIRDQEKEIKELTFQLENTPLVQNNDEEIEVTTETFLAKKAPLSITDESNSDYTQYFDIETKPTTSFQSKELGKKALAAIDKERALTIERLQDLHGSLVARPSEDEKAEDPRGLKVQLMPHQQHALAWLQWREQQKPPGGVLADDMGLGKTLTMISLIMTSIAKKSSDDEDDSDGEWNNKHKPLYYRGGTLVICPASLLMQWDSEVQNRCKRGLLSVEVYHGNNRENVPKRLAKYDMVITTYNIASREHKTNSTLYKIKWKRVILDEAHIIRNYKSKASVAVCELKATKRWALSGTPIQNKEMDLYSILKFLKCSPFDDLGVWKRWVDNKNAAGHERLAAVMKTVMLRRTKQELMMKGDLENLPEKFMEEVMVKLDSQEQLVYEKILVYSRTLFAQFLAQRAEKEHMYDLYGGKYNQPAHLANPNKETQFTKAQNKLLSLHADVKTHEILVLLLRLRQLCCHPALIHAMLDQEDMTQNGIMDTEHVDTELLTQVSNLSLNAIENSEEDIGIDQRIVGNILSSDNPVFNDKRISSKMRIVLEMVKKILKKGDDKIIIVSQWTSLLDVIASHLSSIKGVEFSKFTGNVAIKDRQNVMDSFNNPNSGPRILLLSLTAGGVGLNLVGANHLLLYDIHWNPQLETQAQDRIYRFGQKKNVYIHKFICSNTIEERIKALQERKLEISKNVLSGEKNNAVTKLTFNDLKSLFAL